MSASRLLSLVLGAALAMFTAAASGCLGISQRGLLTQSPAAAKAYNEALRANTRVVEVNRGVGRVFEATFTRFTPALRAAIEAEATRVHGAGSGGMPSLSQPWAEAEVRGVLFFDAADPALEDLARRPSTWRLALLLPSGPASISEVRRLELDDPSVQHFFPFVRPFGAAYALVAPVGPEALDGPIALEIAGPPAQAKISF